MKRTDGNQMGHMGFLAFLVAAAYVLGVAASQWGNRIERGGLWEQTLQESEERLFAKPTPLSVTISSSSGWPHREEYKLWCLIEEATGAELEVSAHPVEGYDEYIKLMLAGGQNLPDLLYVSNFIQIEESGSLECLVSIDDHMELMPDYNRFFAALPVQEKKRSFARHRAGDGKIYCPPVYGRETVSNVMGWMVRKDVFASHGLAAPKNLDEVYQVCKTLKQIYPDSYPLCLRSGLNALNTVCPAFKSNLSYGIYYDFIGEQWSFGATEDILKQAVGFFAKMYAQELIPPNFINISEAEWENFVLLDRGFIMPEYLVRIDYFNLPGRKRNAEYTWEMIPAPKAKLPTGQNKIRKNTGEMVGYVACDTGCPDRIRDALRLINWMYSEKGREILSWGKEGESFAVNPDTGEKYWLLDGQTLRQDYGFGTAGLTQCIEEKSLTGLYSKEQTEAAKLALAYMEDEINPAVWLTFDQETRPRVNFLRAQIYQVADAWLAGFMTGERSLSEWDAFQKELKAAGVEEFVALYAQAYERAMKY